MRITLCVVLALILCGSGSGDSKVSSRSFPVSSGTAYEVTVWAAPDRLASAHLTIRISDSRGLLAQKPLHAFDADFHALLKPRADGALIVEIVGRGVNPVETGVSVEITPSPVSVKPGSTWQTAQDFELGQTVFGSGDERPYAPSSEDAAYEALAQGTEWLRFTSHESTPKLVYFSLDSADRDVPADVDVFQKGPVELVSYREGASGYTPEATQNFPGLMKFRTRTIKPGETYYVRIAANHPAWQLRTELYDVPPYHDPVQAVQAGMNYLVRLGDAWHANMPRRGSVALRTTMPHAETQSCIACHPTQFTARAYLTAVRNGYPAGERPAIDFLLDRLRNNPRPLYGQDGANWARVIFSARTVASRVPVLLDMREQLLGSPRASDVTHGYAEYLDLHWKGRETMAGEEEDGSRPSVSPFEIGLQSWQTFGLAARDFPNEPKWSVERAAVERMFSAAKPANIIDLGWKITGLATIDRAKYEVEISALITQLYQWQRSDGRFPYAFDRNAPASDFITFQAMYALAVAGRRTETDARLQKMVAHALRTQRPEGAWQGDAVYKGFDTPFRDTQFAVMGLSELYPYQRLKTAPVNDLRLLGETRNCSVALRQSPSVLVREAAARECRDTKALGQALGDKSKLVQRAAAESLRGMGSAASSEIATALRSTDSRVRWGALRVFDKHFSVLSSDETLLNSVVVNLSDPAPSNRFAAAKALWQWYSWQSDSPRRRTRILDALAAGPALETNATVMRALTESIYNVMDENVGLLAAWQRPMAAETDRDRTEQALHGVVREQSAILAKHLKAGNRAARMALLTGLWDFHVRHMAIPDDSRGKVDVILPAFYSQYAQGVSRLGDEEFEYAPYREAAAFRYQPGNGFQKVRLGNDGDLIHLFADSGSALEDALLACLDGADRDMTLNVIKAGSVLGDAATVRFTAAILGLLDDGTGDPEIRAAIRYVYENNARGKLSLGEGAESAVLAPLLAKLLVPQRPDALAVILPLLGDLPFTHPLVHDWTIIGKVEALLRDSSLPLYGAILRASSALPPISDGLLMRAQILEALKSGDDRAGATAVQLVVSRYVTDATVSALASQFMAATSGRLQAMLLDQLDPTKYTQRVTAANSYGGGRGLPADGNLFSSRQVVDFVSASLDSAASPVREAARDLISEHPDLATKVGRSLPDVRPQPDYKFFVSRVEPILTRVGTDGKACVMCHASHTIFKLLPNRSCDNYQNALKVVNQTLPRKSLMLMKPTHANDASGDPDLYLVTHGGGQRWPSDENSAEYQTILEWIRGTSDAEKSSAGCKVER